MPLTPPSPVFGEISRTDVDAFNAHTSGPYFGAFIVEASTYTEGPDVRLAGHLPT